MLTLLVAGHKTTATTLTWILYRMLSEPGVWSKVRTEVEAGGHEYLDCVIKETMRLNPTIPFVLRRLQVARRIGSREIPRGRHRGAGDVSDTSAAGVMARSDAVRPGTIPRQPQPLRLLSVRRRDTEMPRRRFRYEMRIVLAEIVTSVRAVSATRIHRRSVRRGISLALSDGLPVRMQFAVKRGAQALS